MGLTKYSPGERLRKAKDPFTPRCPVTSFSRVLDLDPPYFWKLDPDKMDPVRIKVKNSGALDAHKWRRVGSK
jgi:hypothetical protein